MTWMVLLPGERSGFVSIVVWCFMCLAVETTNPESVQEVCQTETFRPTCDGPDEIVVIATAQYGRLKIGRCVTQDFGYLRCMHDVMPELTSQCSGRRTCDIRIDDTAFRRATPCHKDLKSHLWVSYECVKVVRPPASCHYTGHTIPVTPHPPSFIASLITEETSCGSADHPWVLTSGPGQRLNLTLYDFAATEAPPGESIVTQTMRGTCRVYATIREHPFAGGATVCGGQARVTTVFVSTSNRVEVRLLTKGGASVPQFLLKFEALGCVDPAVSHGMRVRRLGDTVNIGCADDEDFQWKMTCVKNEWMGRYENCSTQDGSNSMDQSSFETVLPYATSVVIITVIAVIVVCVILTSGILCVKWRLNQEYSARYPVTELTATQDYDYAHRADEKLRPPPLGPSHSSLQSPQSVSETTSTNEYATMRLLQRSAGCTPGYCSDQISTAPSSQYTYAADHIYESPETMRRSGIGSQGCYGAPCEGMDGQEAGRMCRGVVVVGQRYESPSREQQRTLANTTGNYSL